MAVEPMAWSDYEPVLNTKDAARLLQLHEESLRVFVREGKVACHRFPGGREMRFLRDELFDWLRGLPPGDSTNRQ
jgi:excisionase family DNA binding protein